MRLPLRALAVALLVASAVPLSGCVPPRFSSLVHEEATPDDARGWFVDVSDDCRIPDDRSRYAGGACTPAEFEALVSALAPDRVEGETWAGERVRGRSILLRADTARFDSRPVPLADLRRVVLVDAPGPGTLLQQLAVPVVIVGGLGALAGAVNPDATFGEGAAIGAGIGLALGVSLGRPAETQPFEVVGWAAPPWLDHRLDVDGDGCASLTYPPTTFYYDPVCRQPSELVERSRAGWVERIDLVLRDGSRAEGTALDLDATSATLDGRLIAYTDLARVELRHPRPFAPVVLGAKGALHLGAMGASVGLGAWAADGDPDVLWQSTLTGAAIGAVGGVLLGLIRPSDAVRDVTTLPEP